MTNDQSTPTMVDGIACYHPNIAEDHTDYHAYGLVNLLDAEGRHFWFITRRERILNAFSMHLAPPARILEIGAGTGNVARGLMEQGYEVAVGEMHMSGLQYAKQYGISECYQFDLFDPPFHDEFDAVGLFDVLEHLDEDVAALERSSWMLRPGGKVFATVPAHRWLWSRDDEIAAHKRRYTRAMLIKVAEMAGLRVLEARHLFIFILPLLYLRRVIRPASNKPVTQDERQKGFPINPAINRLLQSMTRAENSVYPWLPNIVGGSLLLVAEKS